MKEAFNHEAVEASTVHMIQNGVYHLQAHRFAENEMLHSGRLLRWAEPKPGSHIVDLGSGIGAQAAAWMEMRPDIKFTLVNLNSFQLDMSPAGCETILCNMEDVPVPAGTFDMALACFSIGHCDLENAMYEAARLLKPGGVFFIYDMVSGKEQSDALHSVAYEIYDRNTLELEAAKAGLILDFYMEPSDSGEVKSKVPEIGKLFAGLQPAIWRFIKDVANDV